MNNPNRTVQIEERKPVWFALSELFLDTELDSTAIESIAQRLASSPFTATKIEEILRFEVTPALKANLMVVAGEWDGFDENWLCDRMAPLINRKPLIRFPVFRLVRRDWKKIKVRIHEIRDLGAGSEGHATPSSRQ